MPNENAPIMNKDQYVHFRFFKDGKIMPYGGATAYYQPLKDNACIIGLSLCSPEEPPKDLLKDKDSKNRNKHNRFKKITGRGYAQSSTTNPERIPGKFFVFDERMTYNEFTHKAYSLLVKKVSELAERHEHWQKAWKDFGSFVLVSKKKSAKQS